MSNKYIVKNCPCYNKDYSCQSKDNITGKYCQDCTDCTTKQIIEMCKKKDYFVKRFPNAEFSDAVQNSELAFDILKLLDIQEIE